MVIITLFYQLPRLMLREIVEIDIFTVTLFHQNDKTLLSDKISLLISFFTAVVFVLLQLLESTRTSLCGSNSTCVYYTQETFSFLFSHTVFYFLCLWICLMNECNQEYMEADP